MKRNSVLELWRFIGSIVILLFHSGTLGIVDHNFMSGWIFVEFFYMVTGYFTYKHFYNMKYTSLDDVANNSIIYTIKKYLNLFSYIIIVVCVTALYDFIISSYDNMRVFADMILEITLLFHRNIVPPLWYLSALFIVFPVFCCLCQIKSKHLLYVIAFSYTVIYYNKTMVSSVTDFPFSLLRATGGLLLGILIYQFVLVLKKVSFSKAQKVLLTIVEEISLLTVVFITYKNINGSVFTLLFMFIGLVLLLSQITYTSNVSFSLFDFLGKLSVIIYIVHYPLGNYLHYINVDPRYSQLVLIISSILLSIILNLLVEKIIKRIHFKRLV